MELVLLPLLLLAGLFVFDGGDSRDDGGDGDDPARDDRAGDDSLQGAGSDRIAAGAGNDLIQLEDQALGWGGTGDDTLMAEDRATAYGLGGADRLSGSDNASVFGGLGDDRLVAEDEAAAYGGAGDDTLIASDEARADGGDGADRIFLRGETQGAGFGMGGAGDDTLIGSGQALMIGQGGNDVFVADLGFDDASDGRAEVTVQDFNAESDQIAVLLGDRQTDDIEITARFDAALNATVVELSEGAEGRFARFTLQGVASFDVNDVVLYGTEIGDVIEWEAENDDTENDAVGQTLVGSGSETITSGAGDDRITLSDSALGFGGLGNDTILAEDDATGYGREGNDSLTGSDNATVFGGEGNDTVLADGTGEAHGGAGNDFVWARNGASGFAAEGNDVVYATQGSAANAGAGDDFGVATDRSVLYGGDGNDRLEVGSASTIYGGAGDDRLTVGFSNYTGAPSDIFVTMSGGAGADSFTISDGSPNEVTPTSRTIITDFDPAQDRLIFESPVEAEFSQSDLRVTSAFDAAGNFTLVTVSQALADGTEVPITLIQLNGITSFAPSDLRLTLEPLED
ncbi:calcium-binding protein [Tabrizicola sp.]|uniref:calcium-binding protein n=1 Tax=Tabrizicola sp. TaxID=2005166 RepID=UPI003D26691E